MPPLIVSESFDTQIALWLLLKKRPLHKTIIAPLGFLQHSAINVLFLRQHHHPAFFLPPGPVLVAAMLAALDLPVLLGWERGVRHHQSFFFFLVKQASPVVLFLFCLAWAREHFMPQKTLVCWTCLYRQQYGISLAKKLYCTLDIGVLKKLDTHTWHFSPEALKGCRQLGLAWYALITAKWCSPFLFFLSWLQLSLLP